MIDQDDPTVTADCGCEVSEDDQCSECSECTDCHNECAKCGDCTDGHCVHCERCNTCCGEVSCTRCGDCDTVMCGADHYGDQHCTNCAEECSECGACTLCNPCSYDSDYNHCDYCCTYCEQCGDHVGPGGECCTGYGDSDTPGWVIRGIKVDTSAIDDGDWTRYWHVPSHTIDPVQAMASFYVLEFMASDVRSMGLSPQFRSPRTAGVVADARARLDELVAWLDPIFRDYLDMIVGGELRYHRAATKAGLPRGGERSEAWALWKAVRDTVGPDALLDAAALAEECNGHSFLGKPWADIARTLHARLTGVLSPHIFVDRVFNLEHNGGSCFNKLSWKVGNEVGWNYSNLGIVGEAHHHGWWPLLLLLAGPDIRELFADYWRATNRDRRSAGLTIELVPRITDNIDPSGQYKFYRPDFGDWWVNVVHPYKGLSPMLRAAAVGEVLRRLDEHHIDLPTRRHLDYCDCEPCRHASQSWVNLDSAMHNLCPFGVPKSVRNEVRKLLYLDLPVTEACVTRRVKEEAAKQADLTDLLIVDDPVDTTLTTTTTTATIQLVGPWLDTTTS